MDENADREGNAGRLLTPDGSPGSKHVADALQGSGQEYAIRQIQQTFKARDSDDSRAARQIRPNPRSSRILRIVLVLSENLSSPACVAKLRA